MDDLIERLENLSTPERRKHGVHADLAMYDAATALRAFAEREKELVEALGRLLGRHVELVECGDCGYWDVETEPEVIRARAVLSKHKEQK